MLMEQTPYFIEEEINGKLRRFVDTSAFDSET
jgi:hypothetical protein